MSVHLVNPSHLSFGVGVITLRWLYAATPALHGRPCLTDETLDVVGIGIHTGNALRGYEIGRAARARGALVVFGGIHATLYPDEAHDLGGAHAVVTGDGDLVWPRVLEDAARGALQAIYRGGRVEADQFVSARWDLLPERRYMWGSVQTVRGCPKHCSFCSVWRTDGQKPRQRREAVPAAVCRAPSAWTVDAGRGARGLPGCSGLQAASTRLAWTRVPQCSVSFLQKAPFSNASWR